jgi:hypothetical protein
MSDIEREVSDAFALRFIAVVNSDLEALDCKDFSSSFKARPCVCMVSVRDFIERRIMSWMLRQSERDYGMG